MSYSREKKKLEREVVFLFFTLLSLQNNSADFIITINISVR